MTRRFSWPVVAGPLAALSLLAGCGRAPLVPLGLNARMEAPAARAATAPSVLESDGNATRLLQDGSALEPALLADMAAATRSIQVHAYLFSGQFGDRMAAVLAERQLAGVSVQLLIDPSHGGAGSVKDDMVETLGLVDKLGVKRRDYDMRGLPKPPTWLAGKGVIDHAKCVVVDGRIAYVGGINFYDHGAGNRDYMVRIEGPAASALGELTNQDWVHSGGPDGAVPIAPAAPAGTTHIEIAANGPTAHDIRPLVLRYIAAARSRIYIQMLMIDDDQVLDALVAAKARGVDVRVMLDPLQWDNIIPGLHLPFSGAPNWSAYLKLVDGHVPLSLYQSAVRYRNLHAKACMIDDRYLIGGSANYTYRAMDLNRETTEVFDAPELAAEFTKTFLSDEQGAKPITSLSVTQRELAAIYERIKRGMFVANASDFHTEETDYVE